MVGQFGRRNIGVGASIASRCKQPGFLGIHQHVFPPGSFTTDLVRMRPLPVGENVSCSTKCNRQSIRHLHTPLQLDLAPSPAPWERATAFTRFPVSLCSFPGVMDASASEFVSRHHRPGPVTLSICRMCHTFLSALNRGNKVFTACCRECPDRLPLRSGTSPACSCRQEMFDC